MPRRSRPISARRKQRWLDAGCDVLEIDHVWCRSIYTKDPNDNLVEFCLTTGSFTAEDRARALEALTAQQMPFSKPAARIDRHRAVRHTS